MTDVHIGTADLPPRIGPERYFEKLGFLEATLLARGLPADKVVRRWRTQAPPRGFALIAPRALTEGRLAPSATRAAELDALATTAAALDAAAIVFRTPAELTPSSTGRDALRRFFAEEAHAERFPGIDRVWQPDGLWELPTTARFLPELGTVLVAIDPLFEDPGVDLGPALASHLERGAAYLRPTGLGRPRGRLVGDDLDALAALVEVLERAYVVFADADAWRSARALKKRVAASGDAGDPDDDD